MPMFKKDYASAEGNEGVNFWMDSENKKIELVQLNGTPMKNMPVKFIQFNITNEMALSLYKELKRVLEK